MIRRLLARPRLAVRYWPCWFEVTSDGRQIIRPVLALQRTADPDCPDCAGTGQVPCGGLSWEDAPDIDWCVCMPYDPLVKVRLPHAVARITAAIAYRRNRHLYSDQPPF